MDDVKEGFNKIEIGTRIKRNSSRLRKIEGDIDDNENSKESLSSRKRRKNKLLVKVISNIQVRYKVRIQ